MDQNTALPYNEWAGHNLERLIGLLQSHQTDS